MAGPAFREVGAWALNHLRITPQFRLVKVEKEQEMRETRTSQLNLEPKTRSENPGLLPDFRGQSMREVLRGGRALGLNVVLEGTGLAVKQTPRPGSTLNDIRTVKVRFMPPR